MQEKESRELQMEELVNKYYHDQERNDTGPGTGFPKNSEFDRQKVYRNILSAISRRTLLIPAVNRKWQVAASVGILLFLSLLAYRYRKGILDYIHPTNTIVSTTAPGEIRVLTLSDGTKIWLNAASSLTYPDRFGGGKREVSLEGEAYFEVAHNAEMPFLIHTDNITTRVLGTSFNISAYEEDENITVAVVQGKVGVSTGTKDVIDDTVFLTPNQRAVYSKENRSLTRQEDIANTTSWKEGKLIYRNTLLPEIIADLQRKYNVEIQAGEGIRNCTISANFNNDSLNKVLRILAELVNGEVINQGTGYYLKGTGCRQ